MYGEELKQVRTLEQSQRNATLHGIARDTCTRLGNNGQCLDDLQGHESFDSVEARVALQTRQHLNGVVMLSDGNEEPGDAIGGPELGYGVL